MNEESKFQKLVSKGLAERPPQVDVADRVMAALWARQPRSAERMDPLAWVAAPAVLAAVAVVLVAFGGAETWSDILVATLSNLPWWML